MGGWLKPPQFLNHVRDELKPFVAIGAFAGLRHAEIQRLDWREVHLADRFIEVPRDGEQAYPPSEGGAGAGRGRGGGVIGGGWPARSGGTNLRGAVRGGPARPEG